jgi:hypothetical protein
MTGCCTWQLVSLLITILASIFYKIPSKTKKLLTRYDIYPQIDNVGREYVDMTYRLIITNICARLLLIPLINGKVMDRTQNYDGWTDKQTGGAYFYIFLVLRKGGQKHKRIEDSESCV